MQLTENLPGILENNQNNFQTAASAIDASVKIFAMRVDSVHQETFKLQSGLNRTDGSGLQDKADGSAGGGGAGDEEEMEERVAAPVRRKNTRMVSTLAKSEAELNVGSFDIQYEEDPLVKKVSATFDTGGAKGLLLNQLDVFQGCTLVFDSGDAPEEAGRSQKDEDGTAMLKDTSDLSDVFSNLMEWMDSAAICPGLANFKDFGKVPRKDDGTAAVLGELPPASQVPISDAHEQQEEDFGHDFADDYDMGGGGDDDLDDGPRDFDGDGNIVPSPNANNNANAEGEADKGGEFREREKEGSGGVAKRGLVLQDQGLLSNDVLQALIANADETGYFKPSTQNWAGPEKWNFKVGSKITKVTTTFVDAEDPNESVAGGATKSKKKSAKGEQQFFIDFSTPANADWEAAFAPPKRGGTKLTKNSKEKARAQINTLPTDVHYGPNVLMSLFTKPKWMIPKQALRWKPIIDPAAQGQTVITTVVGSEDAEQEIPAGATDWYDDNHGGMDNDDDMGYDEGGGFDDGFGFEEIRPSTASKARSGPLVLEVGGVRRDMLVAEPQRVEHIQLGYAKVARAVDVKTLKASIWKCMATAAVPATPATSGAPRRVSALPQEPQTFQQVLDVLPQNQSNVSVPFCFISLLHLANERGLELQNDGLDHLTILPMAK